MEEAKKNLTDIAIDLFTKYGIKQKVMYDLIKKSILEHVSYLPSRRVLYNDCYGGFGYSKEFRDFVNDVTGACEITKEPNVRSHSLREAYVAHIVPFGKFSITKVSESFECFKDAIYIFHKYNFNKVAKLINVIHDKEYELKNLTRNGELLQRFLESSPIETTINPEMYLQPTEWCLMFSKCNFERYKLVDLKVLLDKHMNGDFINEITQHIDRVRLEICQIIPDVMLTEVSNFVIAQKKKRKESYAKDTLFYMSNKDRTSFLRSIEKYGFESNTHWCQQTYYEQDIIQYLLDKYKYIRKDEDSQVVYDCVAETYISTDNALITQMEETFGLLCASGPYAKLCIAEIPALVDYKIGEYDGTENVYVA
jgi:hypothetical protein